MKYRLKSIFSSRDGDIEAVIHPVLLHGITLLIPVNIYIIGDLLGAGVQWPLFRYQETYLGRSFINLPRELTYVLSGILGGKTALAIWIWILGALLLVMALGLAFLPDNKKSRKIRGYLLISGSILFLITDFVLYGPFLHGARGAVIPVGIPVLLILGLLILSEAKRDSPRE